MLMGRLDTTAFSTSAKVVALPVAAGPLPDFDALDYPAILVGTDGAPERELSDGSGAQATDPLVFGVL